MTLHLSQFADLELLLFINFSEIVDGPLQCGYLIT